MKRRSRPTAIEQLPQVQQAMATQHGPTGRCIDCGERRQCDRVRINKYAVKPCVRYFPDLDRMEQINAQKARAQEK